MTDDPDMPAEGTTTTRLSPAEAALKLAAAEAFFEKYGVPPLTEEAIARVEAEWRGTREL